MKRVLVVGESSYIGKSFAAYAKDRFVIKMVNSRDNNWKNIDYSGYDSILHCAGIAHVSQKSVKEEQYYAINCDLAVEVAKKAKSEKVGQFIFLSSMSVYDGKFGEISSETEPNPDNLYGKSKLKAEQELGKLSNENFKLCIVRPPMVYGKNCPGNFPRLVKLVKLTPIFPNYPNKRSMIYIDNLCEFICGAINNDSSGVFMPQNSEYVSTVELAKCVATFMNRKLFTTKLINPMVRLLSKRMDQVNKLFGDLTYIRTGDVNGYSNVAFEESVRRSIVE